MKRYIVLLLIIVLVFTSTNFTSVNADIGPKPAVEVTIKGVDEDYYFDLLIYSSTELTTINTEPSEYYQDEYPDALYDFQDNEGFISYSLYRSVSVVRQSESKSAILKCIFNELPRTQ